MSPTHGESADPIGSTERDSLAAATARRDKLFELPIWLGLILGIVFIYAQVADFDYVSYDDPVYVQNAHVQAGLTPASIRWAFTAKAASNWLPVTLLSFMADAQLFGIDSGAHHLVNVFFHALSAILLYLTLRRATKARGLSAFVAFVFALHPLHVESVAWVAERKDVLSTFFWFLALYAYARYSERPDVWRYLAVAVAFGLGLMSKPMLVTFPFALLLFDLWPLRRTDWARMIWEKIPLLALSAAVSLVTYSVQRSSGALTQILPLSRRIANALVSYMVYVRQTFWPADLACYYPFHASIPLWKVAGSGAALLIVTALAIDSWRRRRYFTMGWLWFLGTLVPVIGLVQVGGQAHADRYMYVPMVGLSIVVAWGAAEFAGESRWAKRALAAAGIIACLASVVVAHAATEYWENSGTLFAHAIESTGANDIAENNLGQYLMKTERPGEAIAHFQTAVQLNPRYALAQSNLGTAIETIEGCAGSVPYYAAALRVNPLEVSANYNLGHCREREMDNLGSIPFFEAAIRADPDFVDAHFQLGAVFSQMPGREADALREFETTVRLQPADPVKRTILAEFLVKIGRTKEAIQQLEAAQEIDPDPDTARKLDNLRGSH